MRPYKSWTVTIVGLGQIGGSLAAALTSKRLVERVRGIDTDQAAVMTALERKYIQEGATAFTRPLLTADLVVLAAPVRQVLRMIPEIAALAHYDSFLMDVCSTKSEVMRAFEKHFKSDVPGHVRYVGGHPIAGTQRGGIAAADPALFEGSVFVLTPPRRLSDRSSAFNLSADPFSPGGPNWRLVELVRALGADPVFLEPEGHDGALARTSHLPYCAAAALARSAARDPKQVAALSRLVGGGFRDGTRVAASPIRMAMDMLLTNQANVDRGLGELIDDLARLREAVRTGDEPALEAWLKLAREARLDLVPDSPPATG